MRCTRPSATAVCRSAACCPRLKEEYTKLKATEVKPVTVDIKRMHSTDGVVVEGIDNCPIKFAKCCSPLPGDEIIGFVTRGFGVSIHKKDCANVRESMRQGENADRWVRAYWADDAKENYKATLDLACAWTARTCCPTWRWRWGICGCPSTR